MLDLAAWVLARPATSTADNDADDDDMVKRDNRGSGDSSSTAVPCLRLDGGLSRDQVEFFFEVLPSLGASALIWL